MSARDQTIQFLRRTIPCLAFLLLLTSGITDVLGSDPPKNRPNIILVNMDDADWSLVAELANTNTLSRYPTIQRLATEGITFTNLHVTTPFCGPSRISLVRGQYAHRTGLKVNDPADVALSLGFDGGYDSFVARGYENAEFGAWMKNGGYRTMFIGKYHHHGYVGKSKPYGWDEFYASFGARYYGTHRFTTETNARGSFSQLGQNEYRTEVETGDILRMIDAQENSNKPFFMYYAPMNPHRPPASSPIENMVDADRFGDAFPGLRMAMTPDFNELQIGDKPAHFQMPLLSPFQINSLESEYVTRARSVASIDRMLQRTLAKLEACNLDDETYLILTSDNGYQLGHHRVSNKLDPFNRSTNVPTIVWGPDVQRGVKANHLLAHIDICPTILDLGNVDIPSVVDGHSFKPLLGQPSLHAPEDWRAPVIIENWSNKQNFGRMIPCTYSGLRYYDKMYVEWATGDNEYYELSHDPFQLNNIYDSLSSSQRDSFARHLKQSRNIPMAPITTITAPTNNAPVKQLFRVAGVAEDDKALVRTSLVIRSLNTGRYYNGITWSDNWNQMFTNMAATGRQMSYWNKDINVVSETDEGMDFLLAMAFATDDSGNYTLPFTWRVIPLDRVPPTTTINVLNRTNYIMAGDTTVTGKSYDNFETGNMRVVVRDQYDQKYWNGTDWQTAWTYTETDVDADGNWQSSFPAAKNKRYQFVLRSVDRAGNVQQIGSSTVFVVR